MKIKLTHTYKCVCPWIFAENQIPQAAADAQRLLHCLRDNGRNAGADSSTTGLMDIVETFAMQLSPVEQQQVSLVPLPSLCASLLSNPSLDPEDSHSTTRNTVIAQDQQQQHPQPGMSPVTPMLDGPKRRRRRRPKSGKMQVGFELCLGSCDNDVPMLSSRVFCDSCKRRMHEISGKILSTKCFSI